MATGNIIVVEPTDDYKRIHKSIIRNKNIDCLTLGIYTKITVLGAEWQLNIKGLSSALNLSDAKIRKSIGILEKEGYIVREPIRGEKGQMQGWNYFVYPIPIAEQDRSKAGYPKIAFGETQVAAENETDFDRLTQKPTTRLTDMSESGEDYNNRPNEYIDLTKSNKEKEKSLKEKENAELFEQCWVAYRRKGHKKKAKEQWAKLKDEEKQVIMQHIKVYVKTRDLVYQADFERYLKNRDFQTIIVKGNNVVFDPSKETDNTYHPITGGALMWNDYYKCYLYTGWYFDGDKMYDGYDDDKRPNGAQIVLNNGRGTLTWNKEQQKWIKK